MFQHGQRPYIIAEIGANHNGDMDLARRLIDAAKAAGANAVKFQSWDTTIFSESVYEKNYFLGDDYRKRTDFTLKQIVEAFRISREQLQEMAAYCAEIGIDFSTTPFNIRQVDEYLPMRPKFIKIASMDVTNPSLLRHAARSGLPIVLSTGFAELDEIDRAVRHIEAEGNRSITILHCVSLYPPEDSEVNLNNMDMLRQAFGYPVGFSDHTIGTEIPIAAIAKGAVIIEKHFTLDKNMFGWDHKMSATPDEMTAICRARDRIHAALGNSRRVVGARELARRAEYRRSIVSARPLKAGDLLAADDIDFRRPGTGLAPDLADMLIGMRLVRDIGEDRLLTLADLAPAE